MQGSTVRAIRERLGLSVEELAFILRISENLLTVWEAGIREVTQVYAQRLILFDRHGLGMFAVRG